MIIYKDQKLLLLRCRSFSKYSFVEEHNAISDIKGKVWLLKTGKSISSPKMKDIMEESHCLILKESKADGGKYYWADVYSVYEGAPNKEMDYPSYYGEMLLKYDGDLSQLNGTWLQIGTIHRFPEGYEKALKLVSNKKSAAETLKQTRSSTLYVFTSERLDLDDECGGESVG